MTSEEIQTQAADVRRRRVPTPVYKTFGWYRALPYEKRVEVEELIGICNGSGPCTAETWVQIQAMLRGES